MSGQLNLPELGAQFTILQACLGIAALIAVAIKGYVTILRMNREDKEDRDVGSPLANFPRYYFDGPISRAFDLLEDILRRIKRIEQRLDEIKGP